MQKPNKSTNRQDAAPMLVRMRRRMMIQAGMAVSAIALTLVMLFAMTAAWYTNIVHTSGLTFQVETWGFNGQITSSTGTIIAGPGDDGVIDLQVANTSDSTSAVSVSFSKFQMPEEIQKRIYFYVDTPMVRNDETMDRVYLNSQESYTYNLFSRGKLTLTETVHNAPQLKWHWVYDVLGYYVQASKQTLSDGQDSTAVMVSEYLRPIEYDYDQATMAYVTENGTTTMELKTVDGMLTPEQFLVEFSKTDGYEGVIDTTKAIVDDKGDTYYPVRVDEDGNGIYAYLCDYTEIQTHTIYDTNLATQVDENGAAAEYPAKLMVSAQKSKNSVVSVTSLNGLKSAVELGVADTVRLSSDFSFAKDETLTVAAGQQLVLDMNGNTITVTDTDTTPIQVGEGGSLTLVNGTIVHSGTGNKTTAIETTGGEIVMSGVNMTGFYRGLKITDNAEGDETMTMDAVVRLVKCEWTTTDCTLMVYGNGAASAQLTQVVIEDSELTSNAITITGGGNDDSYGTDIQIINSIITSNAKVGEKDNLYSAIYQPQRDSVLTIYNSTVTGYTGIALKGGTVNIIGGTVKGLGAGMETVSSFSNSGFNDTGDAVYIETNYGYPIELNIRDLVTTSGEQTTTVAAILSSQSRYALRVYDPAATNVEISIVSGSFTTTNGSAAIPNENLFRGYVDADSTLGISESGSYIVTENTQSGS